MLLLRSCWAFVGVLALSACLLPDYQATGGSGASGAAGGVGGTAGAGALGGTGAGGSEGGAGGLGGTGGIGGSGGNGGTAAVCPVDFVSVLGADNHMRATEAAFLPQSGVLALAGDFSGSINLLNPPLESESGEYNFFVLGLAPSGEEGVWQHHLHSESGTLVVRQLTPTEDGGLVFVATSFDPMVLDGQTFAIPTFNFNSLVVKLDANGMIDWTSHLVGDNSAEVSVARANGGRLLLGGYSGGAVSMGDTPLQAMTASTFFLYVVELDLASGEVVESTLWPGTGRVTGVVDKADARFVYGQYLLSPPDFGVTVNPPSYANQQTPFLIKFDKTPPITTPKALVFGFDGRNHDALSIEEADDGLLVYAKVDSSGTAANFNGRAGLTLPADRYASFIAKVEDDLSLSWVTANEVTASFNFSFDVTSRTPYGGGYLLGHNHGLPNTTTFLNGTPYANPAIDSLLMHYSADGVLDGVVDYPPMPVNSGHYAYLRVLPTACGELIYGHFYGDLTWNGTLYSTTNERTFLNFSQTPIAFDPVP